MINKIYIPTIKRADIQITYNNLPEELRKRVVFVIDGNERSLYNYPCEYLQIPEEFIGSWTQLAQTRKFIHQHAKSTKYAMLDDLIFIKRNSKYFSDKSDIEKSKRKATTDEILRMFEEASIFLDSDDIGIVGLADSVNPPSNKRYSKTIGVFCAFFIDGQKLLPILDKLDTSIRVSEDLLFLFDCLSNGINTLSMNEFLYDNRSERKELKEKRPIWTNSKDHFQSTEHINALKYIQKKYPHGLNILIKDGKYKFRKNWKSVFKTKNNDLLNFL